MFAATLIAMLAVGASPRAIGLVEQGEPDAELASFLRSRVLDTWGLELAGGDSLMRVRGVFRVVLVRSVPGSIEARVEEAGSLLASRELESRDDPRALDAMVWLFVKSAISRAMIDAPPPPPPPAPAARVTTPRVEAAPAIAPLGEWSVHAMAGAHFADGANIGAGIAIGATRRFGHGIAAGAELGYRPEVRAEAINLAHFPIRAFGELDLSEWTSEDVLLSAGVELTADIARATSIHNTRASISPAFSGGPFLKYRIPITGGGSGELALAVEAAASFYFQRRKYLLDAEEIIDGAWAMRATTGLDWRWR